MGTDVGFKMETNSSLALSNDDVMTTARNSNIESSTALDPNSTGPSEVQDNFDFVLYSVVVPLLFGLIALVGIIGNTLVIYVILSKKKMRTVTNLLLLNLAFADLSFVLICPPFTAYQFATSSWPFGDIACKLMHYLLNVTAYVTVYTLVLISVIRYLTIVHNVSTMRIRTKQNIIIMICAIWTVMLLLNIPIFLSYGYHLVDEEKDHWDCENFGIEVGQKLYATFFAFAYLLPLMAICVLSICILRHIQKQRPAFMNKRKTRSENKKKQASRLIILVVVIFALFWLPVHIHLLIAYFGSIPQSKLYQAISVLWNCLAYFNSCVNPIIYNYASKDFRDSFREVMFCITGDQREQHNKHTQNDATVITRLTPEGQENHLLSDDEGKLVKSQDV